MKGTVFQTVVLFLFTNPETLSRVTLASLGTVFQTELVVEFVLLSCVFSCLVVLLDDTLVGSYYKKLNN